MSKAESCAREFNRSDFVKKLYVSQVPSVSPSTLIKNFYCIASICIIKSPIGSFYLADSCRNICFW